MKIQLPLATPVVNAAATSTASPEAVSRAVPLEGSARSEAKPAGSGQAIEARQPTPKELQQAVEELQRKTQSVAPSLQFSVDHDSGRTIIKVTDTNTQELIRQIPAEEVLHLNKEIDRMQGLLFHRQA